ncbi:MAG TPA: DoxX family protein [Puia sp.]|nr:DoxX family protein [Puia sp.]
MNIAHKLSNWGDRHHPGILDVLRMLLGFFLLYRGIVFFNNSGYLRYLIIETKAINESPEIITAIIYYVTYVHIVGGALILLGLFTRLSVLLQLPIVFGAVFFVNITSPYINSELWLSVLVLALLVLFLLIGSGPFSLDRLLLKVKMQEEG